MESEKKQELVIDGNSFYEIDLKCLEEKKQKQEEAEKTVLPTISSMASIRPFSHFFVLKLFIIFPISCFRYKS